MQIVKDEIFIKSLQNILDYVASDNLIYAIDFYDNLNIEVEKIPNMPFKFRQSLFHNDKNIRDLVFKNYVTPYLIDEHKNMIVILNIFKCREYNTNT
jgi:toxin ParE1/3/4